MKKIYLSRILCRFLVISSAKRIPEFIKNITNPNEPKNKKQVCYNKLLYKSRNRKEARITL